MGEISWLMWEYGVPEFIPAAVPPYGIGEES